MNDEALLLQDNFELSSYEALIFRLLKYNLHQPVSFRYFERLIRIFGWGKDSVHYHLGLYLLFIAAFKTQLQFEATQLEIACAAILSVNRIMKDVSPWSSYLEEISGKQLCEIFPLSQQILMSFAKLGKNMPKTVANKGIV